jgi:hypothetical protein
MSSRKFATALCAAAIALLGATGLAGAAGPVTPGAVYSGTASNGGAVTFEVNSSGSAVTKFNLRNVVLTCSNGQTLSPFDANYARHQEPDGSTYPGMDFPISGRQFTFTETLQNDNTQINGSFADDRAVTGVYHYHVNSQSTPNGPTPSCDSGQITYRATTSTPAGPPPPEANKSGTAGPASGTVKVRSAGSSSYVPLTGDASIPVGSTIDARKGTVELTTVGPDGKPQTGRFSGGVFKFTQKLEKAGSRRLLTTELALVGGNFASCAARSAGFAETARRRIVRYLKAKASGRFRVIGKNSSGVERGTVWNTADRCDGTLTSVTAGTVLVTDFRRNKTVPVKAGDSYLAKAARRR